MVEAEVFVTGMAWWTPLGRDLTGVWKRLLNGDTGFELLPHPQTLRNGLAASVSGLPLELPAGIRLRQMAAETIKDALKDAGLNSGEPNLCLVLGTSLGAFLDDPDDVKLPLYSWSVEAARMAGISTQPISISTACSSGSDAIALGVDLIRSGMVKTCICGAADVLTSIKRLAHSNLGTMSSTKLRAFDRRHDGTLLGEGAAFIVLQNLPGNQPYARIRGIGAANDAASLTAPDADSRGALFALQRSLLDAGQKPERIGVINAHGSGTPINDSTEAQAFRILFDFEQKPIVFATKGNFGHSLGATGAIEAIATILALKNGEVPPVSGLEEPDPAFSLPLSVGRPSYCSAEFGLSLTLGFGGFDTSLIFERL